MRHVIYTFILLSLTWPAGLHAGSQNLSGLISLKELRKLVFISDDLDDDTPVKFTGRYEHESKDQDHCLCTCRDASWSCTELSCKLHNQECDSDAIKNR